MSKCHNCGRDHDDPWGGPHMGFPSWDDDCGAKPYVEPPPIPPDSYGRVVRISEADLINPDFAEVLAMVGKPIGTRE